MAGDSWLNKTVVISGGSSGLGLYIAKAAAIQGANVTILGRSSEKLAAAKKEIKQVTHHDAQSFAVDAISPHDSTDFIQWIGTQNVDLLINAIGRSDRGRLEQLNQSDLESLFRDNVLTTATMTQTMLTSLRRARGCIVNIGSLAGIIASPQMGGYCVSKFALSAYSTQLRLELQESNVHVLLVSPGPIRRDDSHNRYRELAQARGMEQSGANAPGGGANLKLLDPERLSETILKSALNRDIRLVLPAKVKWLAAIHAIWPWLGDQILKRNLRH
ncbi:MAG: SDR family NAD(P)-dependent oxidoreductase [Pirellula sp.]|jgi:short-subunit dehydrogenase|nr:SDR family NAD(P)-dependent oxidoreductase [Pirellula sp.]